MLSIRPLPDQSAAYWLSVLVLFSPKKARFFDYEGKKKIIRLRNIVLNLRKSHGNTYIGWRS